MSMEAVFKKQRTLISNFKITQKNSTESDRKEAREKQQECIDNASFHFAKSQNTNFIKYFKSYDPGAANVVRLIGNPNPKKNFDSKARCLSASRSSLLGKNFIKGLKLGDIRYESGTLKQNFLNMNYRVRSSQPKFLPKKSELKNKSAEKIKKKVTEEEENPPKKNEKQNNEIVIKRTDIIVLHQPSFQGVSNDDKTPQNNFIKVENHEAPAVVSAESQQIAQKITERSSIPSQNEFHNQKDTPRPPTIFTTSESQKSIQSQNLVFKPNEKILKKVIKNNNSMTSLHFASSKPLNLSPKYACLTSNDSLPLDSFVYIPNLIMGNNPQSVQQISLSLKNEPIFQNPNISEDMETKNKVQTFIKNVIIDDTPGFDIKELAYFPETLSYHEVNEIKEEFKAFPSFRNYDKLDGILQRLKFFKKFNKIARENILRQTSLIEHQANERIFSEGDYGDLMYIIVKGSVNIKLKKKLSYKDSEVFEYVINSFYDGDHFGDLAMMSIKKSDSRQNRSKPMNLNELTLQDVRDYLSKFYEHKSNAYESNLDSKAFDEEKELRNTFLSSKKKNYFGLEENEQKIERTKRTATVEACERTVFLVLKRDKYQQIFFSLLQENLEEKIRTLLRSVVFESFEPYLLLPLAYYLKEKQYKMGEIVINQGKALEYFQIISKGRCETFLKVKKITTNMKILREGEIIGGRAVLTVREFQSQTGRKNIDLNEELTAKLTVRVESTKCEILYIDKGSFEMLPLDLKNEIRQKIIMFKEFDDYPIEELKNESLVWDKKSKKIKSFLLKK